MPQFQPPSVLVPWPFPSAPSYANLNTWMNQFSLAHPDQDDIAPTLANGMFPVRGEIQVKGSYKPETRVIYLCTPDGEALVTYRQATSMVTFTIHPSAYHPVLATLDLINSATPDWFELVHHTGEYKAVLRFHGYEREEPITYLDDPKVWRSGLVSKRVREHGEPIGTDRLPLHQSNPDASSLAGLTQEELNDRVARAHADWQAALELAKQKQRIFDAMRDEQTRRADELFKAMENSAPPDPFPHDEPDPEPYPDPLDQEDGF